MKKRVSDKSLLLTESVIREMSREAAQHGAINLGQGFPDFSAPEDVKKKAIEAIVNDHNQYAITWGVKEFREQIARKTKRFWGLEIDPENEITVTCGSTEGMIATMLACIDEGEEVILFEPFYENYAPDVILSNARPIYVPLYQTETGWHFRKEELRKAFNRQTKAIIICNPNNPTGKVFTKDEMQFIAELCQEFDALCFTDEIYEHIIYEDNGVRREHICMATVDGMKQRTVVVNSLSKTYSVTGWRVGYVIAPADITTAIRKIHDFLTVGAPNCLQHAGAYAMQMSDDYYENLRTEYQRKRNFIVPVLTEVGFKCNYPEGAYYVMADISNFGFEDDFTFAKFLVREIGVAVVPGSSFYQNKALGRQQVRFCFCKKDETLEEAAVRLQKLKKIA